MKIRYLLILLFTYCAAFGYMWNERQVLSSRQGQGGLGAVNVSAPFVTTASGTKNIKGLNKDDHVIFDVPLVGLDLTQLASLQCLLKPQPGMTSITGQVSMTCDHYGEYIHEFKVREISGDGLSFVIPLRRRKGYWHALNHEGLYNPLNLVALRSLEIKIFSEKKLSEKMTLSFQAKTLPETETETEIALLMNQALQSEIKLGERFELAFDLSGWQGNPFNDDDGKLELRVIGPDSRSVRIKPFVHQEFNALNLAQGEYLKPVGPKHWRARFRPQKTGRFSYQLRLKKPHAKLLLRGSFDVLAGQLPEFIKVSKKNPRYFENSSGNFFYPLGWNVVYPIDKPYAITYVDYLPNKNSLSNMLAMIGDVADNGGNFIRFWMTNWFGGIEWNKDKGSFSGLGKYNLKNAWIVDQILSHCEKRGVYLLFCTMNHTRLADGGTSGSWQNNPYAKSRGGIVSGQRGYWHDENILGYDRKRLSYIVARFADSPAIQSWNLVSEPNLVAHGVWRHTKKRIFDQLQFIKRKDPYNTRFSPFFF